jgi:hypothetical protein
MSVEKFQLGELMQQVPTLLHDIFEAIRGYSTSFIVNNTLIGSGTFVRIDDTAGLLTAKHVWDKLCELTRGDPLIGLQLYDRPHTFFVDRRTLVPLFTTKRKTMSFGPDLEFIKLPLAKIASIEASQKSFYNLSKDSPKRHCNAQTRYGFLIISGFPEEMVQKKTADKGSIRLLSLYNLGMIVAKTRSRRVGRFDYWEMQTEVGTEPRDYGGVSGAGVWRVVLEKKIGISFSAATLQSLTLGGMAFYQSAAKKSWRFIRAHGPDTIYRILPQTITNNLLL